MLLDIALPEHSGLEVLLATTRNPAVIFITAYDAFAITAFELGAFDYLLKPFTAERLAHALARLRVKITERHYAPFCKARQEQLAASVKLAWKKPTQPLKKKRASSSKKHARRQDSGSVKKRA